LWWQEGALDSIWLAVVCFDFKKVLEILSYSLEGWIRLVLFWENLLKVVRIFSNNEVCQGQISQGPLFLADEFLEKVELWFDSFPGLFDLAFVFGVKEELSDVHSDISEDSDDFIDFGNIISILSEEFFLSRFFNDVSFDSIGLRNFQISVDEVREVGEVKAKIKLIIAKPLSGVAVSDVLPFEACVCKKKSWNLSTSSDSPISKFDSGHGDLLW
jgi:hypothetical protein